MRVLREPMTPTPVLDLIRRETAPLHERLETRLDMLNRLADPAGRRRVMLRFWGLYAGIEDRLGELLGRLEGLDFDLRRKTPVLERDLAELSVRPGETDRMPAPALACTFEALGLQYVLEGSTLGGRVIRKDAERRGLSMQGLAFFDVYGSETGVRWRQFREVLERGGAQGADRAASGARRGFEMVEHWLIDGRAPA